MPSSWTPPSRQHRWMPKWQRPAPCRGMPQRQNVPWFFDVFSGSSKEKMAEKKPSENSKFKSINRCEIWWSLMNLMWWLKRIASSAKPDLKGTLRFHKCKHDTSTMIHIMSQMDLCACRSILDSWTIQTNPWTEGRKSEPGFEAGLDQNKTTKLQFQNMFRVPLVKGTDISLWFPGYGCKMMQNWMWATISSPKSCWRFKWTEHTGAAMCCPSCSRAFQSSQSWSQVANRSQVTMVYFSRVLQLQMWEPDGTRTKYTKIHLKYLLSTPVLSLSFIYFLDFSTLIFAEHIWAHNKGIPLDFAGSEFESPCSTISTGTSRIALSPSQKTC